MERKDKRRVGARGGDADLDWLAARGFDELVEAEVMRDSKRSTLAFHNGVEFAVADDAGGLWTRGALPKGTTRK
jgi:hypothetical protein